MNEKIIIYMTCKDAAEAQRITGPLIEQRLIACANIMAPHQAVYHWQGKVETDSEVAVIMKSRAGLFEDIREAILALHSYQCPCIVAWPLTQGHAPYMEWLETETG